MATSGPPIATVYVRNLEERAKPETLRADLEALFSDYGTIIDIVAKRNLKAKGQAFIVFDNQESALKAIEDLQGFELYDKQMVLALAQTRSDATVKATGNEEEFDLHKRRRIAEKDKKKALELAEEQNRLKRPMPGAPTDGRPAKKGTGLKSTGGATGPTVVPDEYLPPNRILFVQNLPEGFGKDELVAIFNRFEGFREVRTVPGRTNIAFVEYETEAGAISAKESTGGMPLNNGEKVMKVTYQRQ